MKNEIKCEIDVPLENNYIGLNRDGVVLTNEVLRAIKDLQEYGEDSIRNIESEQNLLISKYEYLDESSDRILERLAELNFIKIKLKEIINI